MRQLRVVAGDRLYGTGSLLRRQYNPPHGPFARQITAWRLECLCAKFHLEFYLASHPGLGEHVAPASERTARSTARKFREQKWCGRLKISRIDVRIIIECILLIIHLLSLIYIDLIYPQEMYKPTNDSFLFTLVTVYLLPLRVQFGTYNLVLYSHNAFSEQTPLIQ